MYGDDIDHVANNIHTPRPFASFERSQPNEPSRLRLIKVGVFLHRAIAIEGTVHLYQSQSFNITNIGSAYQASSVSVLGLLVKRKEETVALGEESHGFRVDRLERRHILENTVDTLSRVDRLCRANGSTGRFVNVVVLDQIHVREPMRHRWWRDEGEARGG